MTLRWLVLAGMLGGCSEMFEIPARPFQRYQLQDGTVIRCRELSEEGVFGSGGMAFFSCQDGITYRNQQNWKQLPTGGD